MAKKEFVLSVVLQAVDKVTAPLQALKETILAINQVADETVKPFKTLSDAFKEVNQAVADTTSSMRASRDALSGVGSTVRKASTSFDNVKKGAHSAAKEIKEISSASSSLKIIRWRDRLNIAELSSSVNRLSDAFGRMRSAITGIAKLGAVAAVTATAYGGAIATIVKRTTDYGDAAVKTAQKIGIGVEAWQELAYAGNLAGADSEMFASMLAKLNKRIVEAAGGSEDAALWLNRAGVAFKDSSGKARSAEAVFMDLAEVFSQHEDGVKKTALAMGLFEEEGTKLIPLLNSGKAGLQAMRDEARSLGVVIDEKTAKASENFNDNLTRLIETFFGFCNFLAAQLLPVFDEIVVSVRKWMLANSELIKSSILQWVNSFKAALPDLIKGFWVFVNGLRDFFALISQNIDRIGGFTSALKLLAAAFGVILVGSIASAATAIIGLGTALLATPAGWIIMGIAAAALAVYAAFKNWDKIKAVILAVGSALLWPLRAFGELIDYLTSFDLLEIGRNIILSLWNGMTSVWSNIYGGLQSWGEAIFEWWNSFSLFDIGKKIIGSLWDGFKAKWEDVKNWFGGLKNLIPTFNVQNAQAVQNDSQGAQRPFLPSPLETPGAAVTRQAAAAYAGGAQGRASRTETKSSAAVEVRFANLPKGTTVNTVENKGVDLKLNQGYAFVTP